jgi:hypothetical protein
MPRFVILQHDYPHVHWDLMLECGDVLRTWRLASPPSGDNAVRAEPLGDHRLQYLDYEGPVSGKRGQVLRWDMGTFEWHDWAGERTKVRLSGRLLKGTLEIDERRGGGCTIGFTPQDS